MFLKDVGKDMTGGRELKGGGTIKTERNGFNPFLFP